MSTDFQHRLLHIAGFPLTIKWKIWIFISRYKEENPQEVQASLLKVKMEKIDYKRVQELLISLEVDSEEEEVSHDTANLEFSSQEAAHILMQAVSAFYVSMTLQGMSKTADFNSRNIFFTFFMAMVEGWCNSHQSQIENSQIENMLSSWNLQKINIPGDRIVYLHL